MLLSCTILGKSRLPFFPHRKGKSIPLAMEWQSDDDDLSSVWSDSEDEARPASPAELRQGYFSEATLPNERAPRTDMRLRRQETSYTNRRAPEPTPILAPFAVNPQRYADAGDDAPPFGAPLDDDRETVGYLMDEHGQPYAAIRESKPPPPNTNRHGQTHKHHLRRVMGYDPAKPPPRKGEPTHIVNGADLMHGDSELTDQRRAAMATAAAQGDAFHNQAHTHDFSDVDAGRGASYDGYNPGAAAKAFQKRRHHVEHTWRTTVRQEHDPIRGETTQLTTAPTHAAPSTTRREVAGTYRRKALATTTIAAGMDIPVVHHASKREETAPMDRIYEAQTAAARVLPRSGDVPEGEREAKAPMDRIHEAHATGSRVATGWVDHIDGDRELADGGTKAATSLQAAGRRVEADGAQRPGGTDVEATKRQEAATTLMHLGRAQHGLHTAEATDAHAVASHGNVHHGGGLEAPMAAAGAHDTVVPKRALTDGCDVPMPHAGGGAVIGGTVVDIGEDRPPVASSAMWHFTVGYGEGAGRHRAQAPEAKGLSGTCFLGDRLAQPHDTTDWRRYEQRSHPTESEADGGCPVQDRLTPVPRAMKQGEPPLQQLATGGAHMTRSRTSGRSTPRTMAPSPMALR